LTLLAWLAVPVLHLAPGATGITPPLLAAWAGTVVILAWTHRADLRQRPALRAEARE
jgi:hypothetical protein